MGSKFQGLGSSTLYSATMLRADYSQYRELSNLRINYPSVPIMALTATATDIIVKDIIFQLQMKDDCVRLKHSFNRPNLSYTVLHKPSNKALTQNIADWIKSTHPGAAGIIYCLSRENCGDLARELLENHGISAHQFHGGMEKDEKRMVQRKWQNGEILVVVATVGTLDYAGEPADSVVTGCVWYGVSGPGQA
jgi:bloom syndrome protein